MSDAGAAARSGVFDLGEWRDQAACRDLDRTLFFPSSSTSSSTRRAKAVCSTCPVQPSCLQFALATNQDFGVWGGYDERERHALGRRRPRPRQG